VGATVVVVVGLGLIEAMVRGAGAIAAIWRISDRTWAIGTR
jgi:hypothetical protein